MKACCVLYQLRLYIFVVFWVIIADCQLPKFTEYTHPKIVYGGVAKKGGGRVWGNSAMVVEGKGVDAPGQRNAQR